jgi:hypothetical protein
MFDTRRAKRFAGLARMAFGGAFVFLAWHFVESQRSPLPSALARPLMAGKGVVCVTDSPYNAAGDGVTDDTAAFQNALNEVGSAGGGVVFAPTGNFLIKTHLSVPAYTSLVGVFQAPPAFSQDKGTTLLAVDGAGATTGKVFIQLVGPSSTLEGVAVFYPNQTMTNPPVPYPPAIRGGVPAPQRTKWADNLAIKDVLLVNPYTGVDVSTFPCGRHLIQGLYGQPLSRGIQIDQCFDIGRIKDVHFWNFWTRGNGTLPVEQYIANNATAFLFYRSDWEVVEDIFAWGYLCGSDFEASPHDQTGTNGEFTDINFDNTGFGLSVSCTSGAGIHVSNLHVATDGNQGVIATAIIHWSNQNAVLDVRGATFWGMWSGIASWSGPGSISLSDAQIQNWMGIPRRTPFFREGRRLVPTSETR